MKSRSRRMVASGTLNFAASSPTPARLLRLIYSRRRILLSSRNSLLFTTALRRQYRPEIPARKSRVSGFVVGSAHQNVLFGDLLHGELRGGQQLHEIELAGIGRQRLSHRLDVSLAHDCAEID